MSTHSELLGHPLVHALGWTLLHFCWQGALVAGMLWCVLGLLGGRASQARYLASCAAMLLMIALPLLTFGRIAVAEYQTSSATHRMAAAFDMSIFLQAGSGEAVAPWPARFVLALDHAMPWLLAAWMLGAVFFVVRLNCGLWVAHKLRRIETAPPEDELQQRFDMLRRRLGVTRAVQLLHSARVQVPTVIGWLRPAVLVPVSCLTGLSSDQIEAIFCHELAHVRRNDYLVSVFQSLAEALLFYHPAVWWVSRQVRRERECCCDELAVANCGDALAYARALSYLEERRAAYPECVLGANGGVLTMRIKRLLGYRDDAGAPQFAALLLLALVAAISVSNVATLARAQKTIRPTPVAAVAPIGGPSEEAARATPNQNGGQQLRGMYKIWLTQDARWIIGDEERDAFLRLTNDNERDAFITEFWRRRDAPGTAEGSYRDAYYARMAYANEHFASNTRAGSSTDRGRMYLLYGKPELIDSHPGGGQYLDRTGTVNMAYPFEVWHYTSVGASGSNADVVFVDTCRCGEYNYTIDGSGPLGTTDESPARIFAPVRVSFQQRAASLPNAQETRRTGGISGVIVDPTGALVPRANIRAINTDSGFTVAKVTDNTGTYTFTSLPAGTYNVEVAAVGFQRLMQENVKVGDSQDVELNMKLSVGAAAQALTVTGSPAAQPAPQTPMVVVPRAKPGMPLRVSSGTMAGNLLTKVDPIYPPEAKLARVEGIVALHATISKQGTIENVQVISGPPALIVSAIDAVRQWRYKPYLLNGEPTEVDTTININYTFGESDLAAASSAASVEEDLLGLRMANGATPPRVMYSPEPEYTEQARKAKFMGVVLVNLKIDEQGKPQNVHVLRGVGMGLDEKAVEAVKKYRFRPAMKDDKPVVADINIEVNFQIF